MKKFNSFKEEANGNIYLDGENRQFYTDNGGVIDLDPYYGNKLDEILTLSDPDEIEARGHELEEEAEEDWQVWAALEGSRPWYAVVKADSDDDWGRGSFDLEEAKEMARSYGEEYEIDVIDDIYGNPVCIETIKYF